MAGLGKVVDAGGALLKGATRKSLMALGLTGTAAGAWYGYERTVNGLTHEQVLQKLENGGGDLIERINRTFGEAGARAGAQIGLEQVNAIIEAIATFANQWLGGNVGEWFMNMARKAQGLEPKVYTSEGYKLPSELKTASGPAPDTGKGLTASFKAADFKTAFSETIANTPEFKDKGIPADAVARAAQVNSTIVTFKTSELLAKLENSTSDAKIKDGLRAIDSDASGHLVSQFADVQKKGLDGITSLFGEMAKGTAPAEALTKVLAPAAPSVR